jgi:putrescine transport system permease protein
MKFIEKHFGKAWLAIVYFFLYIPLFFMIFYSFNSLRSDSKFGSFSLRWYEALFRDSKIIDGFLLSLKVALATGFLSAILGTFAAFVLVRYRKFFGRTLFAGMTNAPLVIPEVILGLSLLLLFKGTFRATEGLFGTGWPDNGILTIVLGHTLLGMAYAMVVVQSRLLEMNRSIEEAAMDLGAKPFQVFYLVTLPNIFQAILAAFLLSFTLSFDDVVISEFLSGPGVSTLPQVIFGYARRGINPTIYAAATLLIATVTIVIVAYSVYVARSARRREREIQAAARAELSMLKD